MKRRTFATAVAAAVSGLASSASGSTVAEQSPDAKEPKHVCQGRNECKGQGGCAHGCSANGCGGKNDCKGKGGCAAKAAKHACKGQNQCKGMGGCASGDQGCAARNTCKARGGCEVPLKVEHETDRKKQEAKP
jgi:hypothetical protein